MLDIWSTLEECKIEMILEPPKGFNRGTSGIGIPVR